MTEFLDNDEESESGRDIPLNVLVLDTSERLKISPQVLDFLKKLTDKWNEDPEADPLEVFLDRVWPDGLPGSAYASNISHDPNEESFRRRLLIRPVCEGPQAEDYSVGGRTLGLQVQRKKGKLAVENFELTPHIPLREFEGRINAIVTRSPDSYMTPSEFDALGSLPYRRAETNRRLTDWRSYLGWQEQRIREKQIILPYSTWRQTDEFLLEFLVPANELPKKIRGEDLGAERDPMTDGEENSRSNRRDPRIEPLGEVEEIFRFKLPDKDAEEIWGEGVLTPEIRRLRIRLEEDEAKGFQAVNIPAKGLLRSRIAGDLTPLRIQREGVDRLKNNQGFSPRLADFIFDATSATVPPEVPELVPIPQSARLNDGQHEAVAKALAAEDLCLVQGPPGTGKTTVIAEICLRATHEGKRVLVASQTNLAVDNALARLAGVPWVRPLRIGREDRIDDEFKDFLADRVVDRWFQTIAGHCRDRIEQADRGVQHIADLEDAVAGLHRALGAYTERQQAYEKARETMQRVEEDLDRRTSEFNQAGTRLETQKSGRDYLEALLRWAQGLGPPPPDGGEEPWPEEIALPPPFSSERRPVFALDRARNGIGNFKEVLKTLGAVQAGMESDPATASRLQELRREKERIIDSVEVSETSKLSGINRSIKELESNEWNRVTSDLDRAGKKAWPNGVPLEIDTIVSALEPSPGTDAALEQAREITAVELVCAEAAEDAVRKSIPTWEERLTAWKLSTEEARARFQEAESGVRAAREQRVAVEGEIRRAEEDLGSAMEDWENAWRRIWPEAEVVPPSAEACESGKHWVEKTRSDQAERLDRARRWRGVQEAWVQRLEAVTPTDRDHLQALYVRHSNVVGMTCNEAGKRDTWQNQEFRPFDIVIVDEVSKATPPELILPLLLGTKAVLVGDHRQLPPMFRERDASFGEAAEEEEITREEFENYRSMVTSSLFEELFEKAPEEIKSMLWTQYRMHPQIMDAVNQFYEDRLTAGTDRSSLADERIHRLSIEDPHGGILLEPKNHLIWIDSSMNHTGKSVFEEQVGNSKANTMEVRIIVDMLVRLGEALAKRGYGKTHTIEVKHVEHKETWLDVLARECGELPGDTLIDLFREKRIRIAGRPQREDSEAVRNSTLEIRAQKEVGVITFYGAQLGKIRKAIDSARHKHPRVFATMDLRTNTVDRFQGMEKSIVLVSLVRSKKKGGLGGFVREYQRINVGLSRAQQLLVIVGAQETWKDAAIPLPPLNGGNPRNVPAYRNIMEIAQRAGGRRNAGQVLRP